VIRLHPRRGPALNLQAPPVGQPGERFTYTNTGYTAVGVMIERVLDHDLATVIAQRFTEPLSLDDARTDDGSVKATRHTWSVLAPDVVIDMLDVPQVST
jgi:CubicO group peptidase (beta-lactamase class C family)